jgi:hypothetical protein
MRFSYCLSLDISGQVTTAEREGQHILPTCNKKEKINFLKEGNNFRDFNIHIN